MNELYKGMILYHRTGCTEASIQDFNRKNVIILLQKQIKRHDILTLPISHIGEWLFLKKEHIGLTISELADIPQYITYGNNKIQEAYKKKLLENEQIVFFQITDDLLDVARDDFKKLQDLKDVNRIFNKHHKGEYSYSETLEQRLYLLRYFYAYYNEYRLLLKWICSNMQNAKMISLGCGCGIDALALKNIATYLNLDYKYTGIDIEDWKDKQLFLRDDPNLRIFKYSIDENSKGPDEDPIILLFPKSLSDISKDAMNGIIKWIKRRFCMKQEICLAASFINKEINFELNEDSDDQFNRFNRIISVFNENGYEIRKQTSEDYGPNSNDDIWQSDGGLPKPENLIKFFRGELESICNKYKTDKMHCNSCEKNKTKYECECWYKQPILKRSFINYKAVILQVGGNKI